MLRWFYVLAHLLVEAGAARRDARIRFLKAQIEILRRKLGGNRGDRTAWLGRPAGPRGLERLEDPFEVARNSAPIVNDLPGLRDQKTAVRCDHVGSLVQAAHVPGAWR